MRPFSKCLNILLAILIFVISSLCSADVIYLKNGRKISGDIISETESVVSIKTVNSRMTIKQKDIIKIQREEAEITHIRNGDYLVSRGEFNSAIAEFDSALRLDPANPEIATKLADARRKAAESLSASMAPDFAKGDEFLTKGFYDSAIREYKLVVKQHNDDTTFESEANAKIKNASIVMINKATELSAQQDYNKSFEIFQQSTAIFPIELARDAQNKYEDVLNSIFADQDKYFQSGEFAKAIQGYNKMNLTYPGDPVRNAIKSRVDKVVTELTYKADTDTMWEYMTRAQFVIDPTLAAGLGPNPGNFQQMDYNLNNTYLATNINENGNIDLEFTIKKTSVSLVLSTGEKQNFQFNGLKDKKISGQLTPRGDYAKPIELAKIVYSKGINGDRLNEDVFSGIINILTKFPFVQSGKVKIGDSWVEQVNEHRNFGPLEMITNGEVDYTLASYETIAGHDCAKINMDMKLTVIIHGTVGLESGHTQNVDLTVETPLQGNAYIDHNKRTLVRFSAAGDVKLKGQVLGIKQIASGFSNEFARRGPVGGKGAEGGGIAAEGPAGAGRGNPAEGGTGFTPQFQSQQQEIPEISVRVALERNLVENRTPLTNPAMMDNGNASGQGMLKGTPSIAADSGDTTAPVGNSSSTTK